MNIPLYETISICADFLYHGPSTVALSFPEEVLIKLMGIKKQHYSFILKLLLKKSIQVT